MSIEDHSERFLASARVIGNQSLPDPGEPEMPLDYDERCTAIWNRLCSILRDRGQLSRDSQYALELLVDALDEWYGWKEDIRKNGTIQDVLSYSAAKRKGAMKPDEQMDDFEFVEKLRPSVSARSEASDRVRKLLCEFGLTDASFGKIPNKRGRPPKDAKIERLKKYGLGGGKAA